MDRILDFLVDTYWGGLISILIGALIILDVIKNPSKPENAWFAGNLKGWAGGIGFIIIGIFVIVAKLLGKV